MAKNRGHTQVLDVAVENDFLQRNVCVKVAVPKTEEEREPNVYLCGSIATAEAADKQIIRFSAS